MSELGHGLSARQCFVISDAAYRELVVLVRVL